VLERNGEPWIDLRSDTVTLPTQEMRNEMASAEVGDDVYGEDPTVNRLEALSACMLGKEAGLFVPSGTMGNLVSILAHCQRGDEVILGDRAHMFLYEAGGMAALGGIQPHTIPNQPDGTLRLDDIKAAIRADNPHFPVSRVVCLENTHNRCGGTVLTPEYTHQVAGLAHENGLMLHLDGARIFNAAVALKIDAKELVHPADSITFCLSKALSAPVGSVICGTKTFIKKARRMRKQLGGGMRQAGILAAAGIVAIQDGPLHLALDHQRARDLATGISQINGIVVEKDPPPSNMVFLKLDESMGKTAYELGDALAAEGVGVGAVDRDRIRLVTHHWIDDEDIQSAIEAFKRILE